MTSPPTDPLPQNRNAARASATRAKLIATARALFGERGFQAVSAEEIVRTAGATRGALYHHFRDKEDLFCAVYEELENELTVEIGQAMASSPEVLEKGPWEALREGSRLFLQVCRRPEVRRITLIDAPRVLGWERWREIGARYGLGLLEATLTAAIEAGEIEPRPVATLAHMLMGAVDELALMVARAEDSDAAQAEAQATVGWLLEALRR